MASNTTQLQLRKETPTETYNVDVTLNGNWDKIAAAFSPSAIGASGSEAAVLRDVAMTPTFSGAAAGKTVNLTPTWNTSGAVYGVYVDVTHSGAGAASRPLAVRRGGNTVFDVDITTAAAVNGVTVLGSATGTGATLASIGTDTDVDLLLVAKGTGVVKADGVEVVTLTGTQTLTNKTLTTPTIASLANATHTHADAAGGGATLAPTTVTLPVGSAGSPSLAFDSGNGLYSEGTDRLNFATAGVVRAEIDAAGNLGLGVVPSAWGGRIALQIGQAGSLSADTAATTTTLGSNTYFDGVNKAIVTAAASIVSQTAGALTVFIAPSVAAGAVQTFTQRLLINDSQFTYSPSGGSGFQIGQGTTAVDTRISATGASGKMEVGATQLVPFSDGFMSLGNASLRWTTVFATTGTINTSSREAKQDFRSFGPDEALRIVRDTDFLRFRYKADPTYERVGFIAEDTNHTLSLDGKNSDPMTAAAVALAAVKALDARLAALEAR